MRNPITTARQWWVNRSLPVDVPSPLEVVAQAGDNATFRHQAFCQRPIRPCLCYPRYTDEAGILREFWISPHPNRHARRQQAKATR